MRHVAWLSVSAVGLLALAACSKKADTPAATGEAKPAAAAMPSMTTPPSRKPGLWSQTMSSADMNQTMKVCLDADTDAKMSVWGQAMGKDMCSKNSFSRTPGGWSFESVCAMGEAGTVTSKGVVTGDFNSAYTVKISSTTTGSSMPQANGAHEMSLNANWEGACPAGMKGGDVRISMPGMDKTMTINLEQMGAAKK